MKKILGLLVALLATGTAAAVNVTSCQDITAPGTYNVTVGSIGPTGDDDKGCINISGSGVTLDCGGNTILFNPAVSNSAAIDDNAAGTTINNCVISNLGYEDPGTRKNAEAVRLGSTSTLQNSTFDLINNAVAGSFSGIVTRDGSTGWTISGNNMDVSGSGTGITLIDINGSFSATVTGTISGNDIDFTGTMGYNAGAGDVKRPVAIEFQKNADGGLLTIDNNTIDMVIGEDAHGLLVFEAHDLVFSNNQMNIDSSASRGILVDYGYSGIQIGPGNTIIMDGKCNSLARLRYQGTQGLVFRHNTATVTGGGSCVNLYHGDQNGPNNTTINNNTFTGGNYVARFNSGTLNANSFANQYIGSASSTRLIYIYESDEDQIGTKMQNDQLTLGGNEYGTVIFATSCGSGASCAHEGASGVLFCEVLVGGAPLDDGDITVPAGNFGVSYTIIDEGECEGDIEGTTQCNDGLDNDGDGECDLAGDSCEPGVTPGDSGCTDSLDNTEAECGDVRTDPDELCDGASMPAGSSCVQQGFDGGTLACASDCQSFDTSACVSNCAIIADRSGWVVTADSEEDGSDNNPISNLVDGDVLTDWHTAWSSSSTDPVTSHPHWAQVDLGSAKEICAFRWKTRGSGENGNLQSWKVEYSSDAVNWTEKATGTFPCTQAEQTTYYTEFAPEEARYWRLVSNSSWKTACANAIWAAGAELDLYEKATIVPIISGPPSCGSNTFEAGVTCNIPGVGFGEPGDIVTFAATDNSDYPSSTLEDAQTITGRTDSSIALTVDVTNLGCSKTSWLFVTVNGVQSEGYQITTCSTGADAVTDVMVMTVD